MSKYQSLWNYILKKNQDVYQLTYEEIEYILGFKIDHSFLTYKKELKDYGYEVSKISLKEQFVIFKRLNEAT